MNKDKQLTNILQGQLLNDLKSLIEQGKRQAASAVNSVLTLTYWQIGKRINEEVLQGERAEYGKQIISGLAEELIYIMERALRLKIYDA